MSVSLQEKSEKKLIESTDYFYYIRYDDGSWTINELRRKKEGVLINKYNNNNNKGCYRIYIFFDIELLVHLLDL